MNGSLRIPEDAAWLLDRLQARGFEAWAVGGCVRDALLGREPNDWDICTAASPEQMMDVFADCRVVETGLRHGTLTVILHGVPYEITTYRVDGTYTDHRHPDGVVFVSDVTEDLARRDFTVNAMAYRPASGILDPFGGREDLRNGILRCVGEPEKRFGEDALRILRALRFAAVYSLRIEPATAAAAHALKDTLSNVAAERIHTELIKLLKGPGAADILRAFPDVIGVFLPEILPCVGFAQHTPRHLYDVWEHTVRAVGAAPADPVLRLALLFHDTGKPACFTLDGQGVGHMYGHPARSAELAGNALERLRCNRATAERAVLLVKHHDIPLTGEPKLLRRRLNRFGEEALGQLIEVQRADAIATGTCLIGEADARAAKLRRAVRDVIASGACFTLKQLAVNGGDMMRLGLKGPEVGAALHGLLDRVLEGELPNDRSALLAAAKQTASPAAD